MTIQLLFFAQARERAGGPRATLELPDGSRVRDALAKIRERYPALVELMPHLAVAMNQRLVGEEEAIVPGAELALLPPVSGGAPTKASRAGGTARLTKTPAARSAGSRPSAASLRVMPATPARWADLEKLFGPRGACAGCWCMWCRLPGKDFKYGRGLGNKRRLRRLVNEGPPPGLIGYLGKEPVAWCAIGPREHFQRLSGSRTLAPVDDRPVWSVPCFFVARAQRRSGLTARMLGEAAKFAKARGASILEGYPIEPGGKTADAFAWWGLVGAFEKAGFDEVLRRSPTHPIMRRRVRGRSLAPKPRARPRG